MTFFRLLPTPWVQKASRTSKTMLSSIFSSFVRLISKKKIVTLKHGAHRCGALTVWTTRGFKYCGESPTLVVQNFRPITEVNTEVNFLSCRSCNMQLLDGINKYLERNLHGKEIMDLPSFREVFDGLLIANKSNFFIKTAWIPERRLEQQV